MIIYYILLENDNLLYYINFKTMTYEEKWKKLYAEIDKRREDYLASLFKHYNADVEAKAVELGKILVIMNSME